MLSSLLNWGLPDTSTWNLNPQSLTPEPMRLQLCCPSLGSVTPSHSILWTIRTTNLRLCWVWPPRWQIPKPSHSLPGWSAALSACWKSGARFSLPSSSLLREQPQPENRGTRNLSLAENHWHIPYSRRLYCILLPGVEGWQWLNPRGRWHLPCMAFLNSLSWSLLLVALPGPQRWKN